MFIHRTLLMCYPSLTYNMLLNDSYFTMRNKKRININASIIRKREGSENVRNLSHNVWRTMPHNSINWAEFNPPPYTHRHTHTDTHTDTGCMWKCLGSKKNFRVILILLWTPMRLICQVFVLFCFVFFVFLFVFWLLSHSTCYYSYPLWEVIIITTFILIFTNIIIERTDVSHREDKCY